MFDPDSLETRDVIRDVERFTPKMMLEQEIYQKKRCEIMNIITLGKVMFEVLMNDIENVTVFIREEGR
tara:strand:- start:538 stop:741 length:204 start_codon:yes stop_codon:yes gene_type:complete